MNVICPHCHNDVHVTVFASSDSVQISVNGQSNVRSNSVNAVSNMVSNSVKGTIGVSGSDLDLSESDPDPSKQFDLSANTDQHGNRRGRKDLTDYPLGFLALWALAKAQGKAGNKYPAFKSYLKLKPNAELNALILTRFEEWTRTDQWRRGFNQHLSTWLNQRGWEEAPTEADIAGPSNARPVANGAAPDPSSKRSDYCDDHLDGRSKLWSSRPMASCPTCRHQRAMHPKHPRVVTMEQLFSNGESK